MKIEIKHSFSGKVLFAHEEDDNSIRSTVEVAVGAGADPGGATLVGERPILQVGPIGSRQAHLTAYITDKGVLLSTGCFFGDIAAFRAKLAAEHGDNVHAKEYTAALILIELHAELWTPKEEK